MKKRLLIFLLLILGCSLGYAQGRKTVTGTVKDAAGEVMPGVSVIEKGTTNGTQTKVDGTYSLTVAPNATLRFSFLGFAAQEISAGSNSVLNITLATDEGVLNEVVVVGFGMKKETRKLSYSAQEIKGADLIRANEPNITNALQGKVAGVVINQGAGGPQSSSRIRIRGNSSLRANTQPLVVVDGVLIQPGVTGGDSWGGNSEDFGNAMKNLNPDDYESISVLKGSAASALYGSLAQNGVLLITTKKGQASKNLGISYNITNSYEDAYKTVAVQNEFGAGIAETFPVGTDGVPTVDRANLIFSYGPKYNGQQVRDLDGRMISWNAQPNNMLDIYRTGVYTNANIAVQGGSDRGTFRVSYTNMGSQGVLPNNKLNRNAIDLRASQKLGNIFNLDAGVNYTMSDAMNPMVQGVNQNPVFALTYGVPRNFDVNYWETRYEDTQLGGQASGATLNPYGVAGVFWNIYKRDTRQDENNLRANLDLTTTITPWLNFLIRGNISSVSYDNETKNIGSQQGYAGGSYSIGQASDRSHRLQALFNLTRPVASNLDLSLSVGGENSRQFGRRYSTSSTNGGLKVPGGFFIGNSINAADTRGGVEGGRRIDAVYAFGDLSYKDMLTFNFSVRNDWSSTLTYPDGSGDHSYLYPAVGLSWVFSDMFKEKLNFLSFGKLRASYGYTGLDTDAFRTSAGKYSFLGNFRGDNGVIYPRYGNENLLGNQGLKNELTKEFEIGADLRFFNERLGLDISYYKKNTTNQILSLAVPVESGINSMLINAGDVQNQGIEILLDATPIRSKNFRWNTTLNFAANRNKIIALAPGVTSYELGLAFGADVQGVAIAGKEYGRILSGYSYGTFQAKDASGNPIAHPNNGQKALKANGSYWRSQDVGQGQKDLGTMMEKFTSSSINSFNYKDITVGFQVDAKIGGMMASATHQYGSTYGSFKSTLPGRPGFGGLPVKNTAGAVISNDGVIPEGVFNTGTVISGQDVSGMTYAEAVSKGIAQPVSARLHYARLTQWSTGIREYSVFENSWVAVREVSVGYNLPKTLISKIKMNSMRVSLTARNLGYFYTTTPDDINPEGMFSNRAGTFAEYGGMPYVRTFGLSLRGDL